MDPTDITITLPLSWQGFYVILTAAGIAAMTGLIFLTLGEHERKRERASLGLLTAFAWLLLPVWLLLFAGTLWQVWYLLTGAPSMLAGKTPLGTGALLAALLGAPFVVWGAVLRQRTVDFQKEGHITERITAAVEQLGAEKSVKKIVNGAPQETSEPIIEVRIGAILSLERIAQDSTRYDKGRDHVRVMEILCAYVRENSNARPPRDFPLPDWQPLPDEAIEEARAAHEAWREARFADNYDSNARQWAGSLHAPCADIAQALRVLGRRTAEQRRVEAAWPDAPQTGTDWPFDTPAPDLRAGTTEAPLTRDEIAAFKEKLRAWGDKVETYSGYRLDLRGATLQAADLSAKRPDASDAVFSGALLTGARLEGATITGARMEGARLAFARMNGADLSSARVEGAELTVARMEGAKLFRVRIAGANLVMARMEGADLSGAEMQVATLSGARLQSAVLGGARMEGASISHVRMEGANLHGARMEGANLIESRMEGAELFQVRMNDDTSLSGAAVRHVNLANVELSKYQANSLFGDASVTAPIQRPAHWPDWELPDNGDHAFYAQWRNWRADPEGYSPPPKPEG